MITTKRIYDGYNAGDGIRILVDRLWPRGIKKELSRVDYWLKDIAPSSELRKLFHQNTITYGMFEKQYLEELEKNLYAEELLTICKKSATVTLLFASKDQEHNNAEILRRWLDSKSVSEK